MNILYLIIVQIFNSILFAICEAIFYYMVEGFFYTTIEQFILSFALSPFILQVDRVMSSCGYSSITIILIYPILFWMAEIVGGFTLRYYFDKNNAWTYNTPDALFYGTIRLFYYPLFLLLGIICHYVDVLIRK